MSRPKNAVILVSAPRGWFPLRVHHIPHDVSAARFHAKNLTLPESEVITGTFNLAHLQKDAFAGEWALARRTSDIVAHKNSRPGHANEPESAET